MIASLFCLSSPNTYADIAIVTHPDNPMADLDEDQLKRIFLGVKRKRASGEKILIIDQYRNNSIRTIFYQTFTGKSVAQINSRWASLLFSGKATPPQQVLDDKAVKDWIQTHPFGFGYIHIESLDSKVKQIMSIPLQ
ncbi:MAG: hypothetical protein COB51_04710 [Moraxellaceae bacterium]|nr:MAG: hypothetical protein COB51_04710 [Moraxellaceae bacterium]